MATNNDQDKSPSSVKQALQALEMMQAKITALENETNEPIAIVGMGCRFPGNVNSPEDYWNLLKNGKNGIVEIPKDRWDANEFYDPNPDTPGKMNSKCGGFISNVDLFDAAFFGIVPREVVSMDPQQRLLLEVCWEALESAGIVPEQLTASSTGVYVGIGQTDYAHLEASLLSVEDVDPYMLTGGGFSFAAGRISYVLGLQGPCIAVDTACSSSLVTIHMACQSLRLKECDLALAGGVQLMLTPEIGVLLSKARVLSAKGKCSTFSTEADGFVRGEGCGMIALKRLSDAVKDGDHIWAVIKGGAINHDGKSSGFTAPNGRAQQAVIRQAITNAKLSPKDISYVEAHGTGTPLGDPIEVDALDKVFSPNRSKNHSLLIGSVKTNIGHLEAAAGVAGLIKVVMAMQHKILPASLNVASLSTYIPWDKLSVKVVDQLTEWNTSNQKRIAGISSFGISGTNAHIIIEETPVYNNLNKTNTNKPVQLLTLSAKSEQALLNTVDNYIHFLEQNPNINFEDVCYSSNVGRSNFESKIAVLASSAAETIKSLSALKNGETGLNTFKSKSQASDHIPKVAFLFTGQGSQYVGMCREFYNTQPIFRNAILHCNEILKSYLDIELIDVLYPTKKENEGLIDQTIYTQPALFSIGYALNKLMKSIGISPQFVIGHSVGEYMAAYEAGVFSLEDGLKLIAARGKLMQSLEQNGSMVSVFAKKEKVEALLQNYKHVVSIAAVNGLENIVISGEANAVNEIVALCEKEKISTKELNVSHAFHSPLMNPILNEFKLIAQTIKYSTPTKKIISNVSGKLITNEIANAAYWTEHILATVHFTSGIENLYNEGCIVFIEIGPKPILLSLSKFVKSPTECLYLPTIRPEISNWKQLSQTLAQLYVHKFKIDWNGFSQGFAYKKIVLPTYPFQRKRYWVEASSTNGKSISSFKGSLKANENTHPLLGHKLDLATDNSFVFQSQVCGNSPFYLKDHMVFNQIIFPGMAYAEMMLSAGSDLFQSKNVSLKEFYIPLALVLKEDSLTSLQTILTKQDEKTYNCKVFSLKDNQDGKNKWILHAEGNVRLNEASIIDNKYNKTEPESEKTIIPVDFFYKEFSKRGLKYGPTFILVNELCKTEDLAIASIAMPIDYSFKEYICHPLLLDACIQVLATIIPPSKQGVAFIPVGFDKLELFQPLVNSLKSYVYLGEEKDGILKSDIIIKDQSDTLIAIMHGFQVKRADASLVNNSSEINIDEWFYKVDWQEKKLLNEEIVKTDEINTWVVFSQKNKLSEDLYNLLSDNGNCIRVFNGEQYQKINSNVYYINSTDALDFQKLVMDIKNDNLNPTRFIYSCDIEKIDVPNDLDVVYQNSCYNALYLVQAINKQNYIRKPKLCILTRAAQPVNAGITETGLFQTPLLGLSKVVAMEHPELRCLRIDLDSEIQENEAQFIFNEIEAENTNERQIAFRNDKRYVARLENENVQSVSSIKIPESTSYELSVLENGDLDSLGLLSRQRIQPADNEVEIRIYASGLNFRDVLMSLSTYNGIISPLGSECAGEIVAVGKHVKAFKVGDNVIALSSASFSKYLTLTQELVIHKPTELNYQEAAAIPINYITAYYALHHLAKIKKGDRVLIHSAAGGTGLAAVQIARDAGAEVMGTASKPKWEYLKSIGVKHVFNSRTLDFADEIMQLTNGKGVDIVLNSFTGDFISKSLSLLSNGGKFLEIGLAEVLDDEKVKQMNPSVSYFPINLGTLIVENRLPYKEVMSIILEKFKSKALTSAPIKEFDIRNSIEAFRYMQQAKHTGKIVIIHDGVKQEKELKIVADASYIITGGYGGLGLEIAKFLVDNGANNLFLLGRSKPSENASKFIEELRLKATINVVKADVTDKSALEKIITNIDKSLYPLKGIIHAAGIVDDNIIVNQTKEQFKRVLDIKMSGAWHLHQLTLQHELDFFVLFSSVSSLMGSFGQANYAAANTFLDGLAHYRKSQGLPALSINWGIWTGVGLAVKKGTDKEENRAPGVGIITPSQGIKAFEKVMRKDIAQIGIVPIDWNALASTGVLGEADNFILDIANKKIANHNRNNKSNGNKNILNKIKQLEIEKQKPFFINYLQELGSKVMGLQPSEIDPNKPMNQIGLDSLMAVELKNKVKIDIGIDINVVKFMEGISMDALATEFVTELNNNNGNDSVTVAEINNVDILVNQENEIAKNALDQVTDVLVNVDNLTEEELDKLLNEMRN